ncbi:MAG TPA: UDP-N-acetylglucosamine--N-acetylmuramyl-(pentapeptide) pyrophosphoryl-undecaprenol N-acetylglucosamine transferase [Phycisphaerales bacterium]|nr:UDP-N-acetylglucosamine--N-acetylmuramyl-(pentapeptide) pyrophosphoryl-undecaprenol N-acetylglucosamine transferase [Phycisphaerales bacterium]
MQRSAPTILFAGGGTGGHLFPALAIAEEVLERNRWAKVRFLCSDRPLDTQILSDERAADERIDFEVIPAKPFGARPLTALRFLKSWGGAVRAGRRAIEAARAAASEEGRVWVVAGGGFVAAPVVQAARVEKVPVLMLNLDATPGLANRWISKHATKIVTTAPVEGDIARGWDRIPPIVRRAATAPEAPEDCRHRLGLDPHRPTLFVTGASQGAASINQMMVALVKAHGAELSRGRWQVVHQTGKADTAAIESAYRDSGVPAKVFEFSRELGVCWGAADLAVSRAGAGSVAEAWANGVPTLFMPYPYHKDQHQKKNAEPLMAAGAAVVVDDLIEPSRNVEGAGARLMELLRDGGKRAQLKAGLRKLGAADGAAKVAAMLLAKA